MHKIPRTRILSKNRIEINSNEYTRQTKKCREITLSLRVGIRCVLSEGCKEYKRERESKQKFRFFPPFPFTLTVGMCASFGGSLRIVCLALGVYRELHIAYPLFTLRGLSAFTFLIRSCKNYKWLAGQLIH